jgi:hypothetical protein
MKAVRRVLRKHLSPLGGDTVTMLNLPPVRMGLLTKLNLLTIGLIFLTAVAITGFYFTQRWRDAEQELKTQGASMLSMMAELAEYGVHTSDRTSLEQMLDSMGADPDVAYVAVFDMQQVLAERRFAPVQRKALCPRFRPRIALSHGPDLPRRRSSSTASDTSNSSRRLPVRWPGVGPRGDTLLANAATKRQRRRRSDSSAWACRSTCSANSSASGWSGP